MKRKGGCDELETTRTYWLSSSFERNHFVLRGAPADALWGRYSE
jgi:hypothetical protein